MTDDSLGQCDLLSSAMNIILTGTFKTVRFGQAETSAFLHCHYGLSVPQTKPCNWVTL